MTVVERTQRNPFPGLRSFQADESHLFFGREEQIRELLRRLRRHRFLAVVGTSGSGKSSLIRAGLIPRLLRGYRTRSSERWRIATITPSNDPIGRLARALIMPAFTGCECEDFELQISLTEATLRRSALGLVEAIRQSGIQDNILLLVDQFEELFRIRNAPAGSCYENQATAFVNLLLESSAQVGVPIHVLITLRSDFLGDCAHFRGLSEEISKDLYLVPRMSRAQRRQVIEGPIQQAGGTVAARLVHRLLNDVGDDPDQLPILQHALTRTWEHWAGRAESDEAIDLRDYEAIGTMTDALEWHADEAYHELPEGRPRRLAELMFKALTATQKSGRQTRRPTTVEEICRVAHAELDELSGVVEAFRGAGRSFLLPGSGQALDPTVVLDISHESLIRAWKRLRVWVREESRAATQYIELVHRAIRQRDGLDSYLLNPALQLAEQWRQETAPTSDWAHRYHPEFDTAIQFLDESLAREENRTRVQQMIERRRLKQAEELARERGSRLLAQRKAARRLKVLSGALLGVLVLALGAAMYARIQSGVAERAARESFARELAMASVKNSSVDTQLGLLLALKAADVTREAGEGVLPEVMLALNSAVRTLENAALVLHYGQGAPEGSGPSGHNKGIIALLFDPLSNDLISASEDGHIVRWNYATRSLRGTVDRVDVGIERLAISPRGSWLVAATKTGEVSWWDQEGVGIATSKFDSARITALEFLDDEKLLVGDMSGQLMQVSANQETLRLGRHESAIAALSVDRGANLVASGDWNGKLRLWNAETGEPLISVAAHQESISDLIFFDAGSKIVSTGWDGAIRIWEVETGRLLLESVTAEWRHEAAILSARLFADSRRLITASRDQTLKLWNLETGNLIRTFPGHVGGASRVVLAPDGRQAASIGMDKVVRVWDVMRGMEVRSHSVHDDWILSLVYSPDGRQLVSAGDDRRIIVWNLITAQEQKTIEGYQPWQSTLAISPDNERIASLKNGNVILDRFNRDSGKRERKLVLSIISSGAVRDVAFSLDGQRIALRDENGVVSHFYLEEEPLLQVANRFVQRRLTSEERALFLREDPED